MSELCSVPSPEKIISTTMAKRSDAALSEVKFVESFSGSIGNVAATVYTEVVFCRA